MPRAIRSIITCPTATRLPPATASAGAGLLAQAAEFDPSRLNETEIVFADFLRSQFGVQTMARLGFGRARPDADDKSGPYALHTLSDDETIARLATGLKRFKLPAE